MTAKKSHQLQVRLDQKTAENFEILCKEAASEPAKFARTLIERAVEWHERTGKPPTPPRVVTSSFIEKLEQTIDSLPLAASVHDGTPLAKTSTDERVLAAIRLLESIPKAGSPANPATRK